MVYCLLPLAVHSRMNEANRKKLYPLFRHLPYCICVPTDTGTQSILHDVRMRKQKYRTGIFRNNYSACHLPCHCIRIYYCRHDSKVYDACAEKRLSYWQKLIKRKTEAANTSVSLYETASTFLFSILFIIYSSISSFFLPRETASSPYRFSSAA